MATSTRRKPNRKFANGANGAAAPEQMLDFYRRLLLIRRFEEKAGQMYGMGLIGGFCHLYIGQEAVVTGVQAALNEGQHLVVATARDYEIRVLEEVLPQSVAIARQGEKIVLFGKPFGRAPVNRTEPFDKLVLAVVVLARKAIPAFITV